MKRTYQPKKQRRNRTHGFRKRMKTPGRTGTSSSAAARRGASGSRRARRRSSTAGEAPQGGAAAPPPRVPPRPAARYAAVRRRRARPRARLPRGRGRAIGITVSSKIANAVGRNRVKRWVREAFRAMQGELPAVDLVVIARAGALAAGRRRRRAARSRRARGARSRAGERVIRRGPRRSSCALYQRLVSPLLPPACRFYPSCSAYAATAARAPRRAARGLRSTARRLLRCHPFHPGGIDPVP